MRIVNLEIITDMQSWCKSWPLNGCNRICVKQNLLRKQKGVYESFSCRRKSQKSFMQKIRWNLADPVKIYHGIIVHPRLTVPQQMVLLKEQYAVAREELL